MLMRLIVIIMVIIILPLVGACALLMLVLHTGRSLGQNIVIVVSIGTEGSLCAVKSRFFNGVHVYGQVQCRCWFICLSRCSPILLLLLRLLARHATKLVHSEILTISLSIRRRLHFRRVFLLEDHFPRRVKLVPRRMLQYGELFLINAD